jgi:hypothetical protein
MTLCGFNPSISSIQSFVLVDVAIGFCSSSKRNDIAVTSKSLKIGCIPTPLLVMFVCVLQSSQEQGSQRATL